MSWNGYTCGRAYYHDEKGERYYYEDGEKVMAISLDKMPCGHPRGCVISSDTTNHCGWCDAEARAEVAEKERDNYQLLYTADSTRIAVLNQQLATAEQRIAELEPLIAHHQKHHDILCTLFGMAGKRMHERDDGQCLVEYWRRVTRIWEQKVTELERLVPEASFLEAAADALGLSASSPRGWLGLRKELREQAAAIRKHREEQDAAQNNV